MEKIKAYYFKNIDNQINIGDSMFICIHNIDDKLFKLETKVTEDFLQYLLNNDKIVEREIEVDKKEEKTQNNETDKIDLLIKMLREFNSNLKMLRETLEDDE